MRFLTFLNEWRVETGYAGRDVATGDSPIIWIYLNKPALGLIWSNTKGDVYHFKQKIGKIDNYSPLMTHKNLLAAAYDKLGLKGDKRQIVDDIVDGNMDSNIRGRVVKDTIHLYSGFNKKLQDKAVEAIYDYIPEH
jgi:hypothetical protein